MHQLFILGGVAALATLVAAPCFYLGGNLSLEACKQLLLGSTVVWFAVSYVMTFTRAKTAEANT